VIVILKQAFFAPRRIWASRAKRRVPCDAIIARLARFLTKLHHYQETNLLKLDFFFK
jgi:hypothetical protein